MSPEEILDRIASIYYPEAGVESIILVARYAEALSAVSGKLTEDELAPLITIGGIMFRQGFFRFLRGNS